MNIAEIRALSDADLATQLGESERALMNLRFRVATLQLANVNEVRKTRRQIAKIKTVMRERELATAAQ
ncbi:MAG: 50S ribosomal protein L29 [SAR202 cluster bacterium]|nr:50S ribosomal protein L29 [SAR202 cluster bacterium]